MGPDPCHACRGSVLQPSNPGQRPMASEQAANIAAKSSCMVGGRATVTLTRLGASEIAQHLKTDPSCSPALSARLQGCQAHGGLPFLMARYQPPQHFYLLKSPKDPAVFSASFCANLP